MKYDKDYKKNKFMLMDGTKISNDALAFRKINTNLASFEYFSGFNKIQSEYNYLYASYHDILESILELKNYDEFYSEYKDELEYRLNIIIDRMGQLSDKLHELNKVEEEIMKGKQLIIFKG